MAKKNNKTCSLCEGSGKIPMPDGPDDFQWVECNRCQNQAALGV